MVLASVLFAATGLVAGGLATAIPPRIGATADAGAFSVPQVRNERHHVRQGHGPIALAKAYRKYGVSISDELLSAVSRFHSKRSTGSEITTPEEADVEYLTPVSIGSPPQVLNLDFDTGSSDLWVFSSETPKGSVNGQAIYSPAKSNTSKPLTDSIWSIRYGDGSTSSGSVYTDKVAVGGLTVAHQAVETATKVSASFTTDSNNDGLLGLGFSTINAVSPTQQKTFFENAQPALDAPVFTADLKYGKPGRYNFGFIDKSAYTGSIAYTPANNSQGYWMFTSSGYSVGNNSFTPTKTSGIADTGTTLLLLPSAVAKAYYGKVSGAKYDSRQGGYVFACEAKLPDYTFGIGSARITIPGSYVNFAPVDDAGQSCYGGIQEDSGIGFSIYGDIALKAAFVVFDAGNTTVGWASKSL